MHFRDFLSFLLYALWMQILVLPQLSEGLSCFSCNSKTDDGCNNDDLKSGHKNNMYSKKCEGSQTACVKLSAEVKDYYEAHFSGVDMKRYYTALDKAAACRGTAAPAGTDVTSAPGGAAATTGSADGPPGAHPAAGGDSDSDGDDSPGAGGDASAPTAAPTGAPVVDGGDGGGRRRRADGQGPGRNATAANCPDPPTQYPEMAALVERSDSRVEYLCGDPEKWKLQGMERRCHKHSDGILHRTICVCTSDLCNGAAARAAVPFLMLAVALLHLQATLG